MCISHEFLPIQGITAKEVGPHLTITIWAFRELINILCSFPVQSFPFPCTAAHVACSIDYPINLQQSFPPSPFKYCSRSMYIDQILIFQHSAIIQTSTEAAAGKANGWLEATTNWNLYQIYESTKNIQMENLVKHTKHGSAASAVSADGSFHPILRSRLRHSNRCATLADQSYRSTQATKAPSPCRGG